MTAQEMINKFIVMVDDELDADYQLQLVNDAISEVEAMTEWEVLKRTVSFSANELDLSTMNFAHSISLFGTGNIPYSIIPIEQVWSSDYSGYLYYIDYSTNKLKIVDSADTQTKQLTYKTFSDDLEVDDTWNFPARFHKVICYKMAEIYYASDAGEKSRSWDDRWAAQFERALAQMQTWDAMIKVRGRNRSDFNYYNPRGINDPRI